jgi:GNAT superfamily N-acetyltransferase
VILPGVAGPPAAHRRAADFIRLTPSATVPGSASMLCEPAGVVPSIRCAVPEDADVVTAIYVASWNAGFAGHFPPREATPQSRRRWAAQLTAPLPSRWWIAEIDRTAVGFAGVGTSRHPADPTLGELDTIAVAPAHWRQGIGRALIQVAMHHLQTHDYEVAILWTVHGLEGTEQFYRRMGWRPEPITRDRGRQVRYRLDLTDR